MLLRRSRKSSTRAIEAALEATFPIKPIATEEDGEDSSSFKMPDPPSRSPCGSPTYCSHYGLVGLGDKKEDDDPSEDKDDCPPLRLREDSDSEDDTYDEEDDEVVEEELDSGEDADEMEEAPHLGGRYAYLSRKRKSYTIKTKRGYLKRIGERKVGGVSQREARRLDRQELCHYWHSIPTGAT